MSSIKTDDERERLKVRQAEEERKRRANRRRLPSPLILPFLRVTF
jgi:hypothetical protein